ncbi:interleukin-2 receptor subunit beta [Mergus octosetaceus]
MNPFLLLLCHLWLISLTPLLLASVSTQGTSSLACWYDSRAAIFCDWTPGRDLADAPCQLEISSKLPFFERSIFLPEKFKEHCELPKAEHTTELRRCIKTFSKNSNSQSFTTADRLNMSVHCRLGENRSTPARLEDFSPLANRYSRSRLSQQPRPKDNQETSRPVLPALIVSTCIFVIIGTAFLINLRTLKWFKKILKIHIPDPKKFFPPLVSVHGGDIQKWLSSPFSSSSYCVNSITPEISVLEVMQKNDQEAQLLLSKGPLTPDPPAETSGHSVSSCFTNQGYFFFHLPNSFEIEPCQVYFTYEPFTQEGSGSEDSESYHALPSPDLCTLAEDMPMLSHNFLHCFKVIQGFQNGSFVTETQREAQRPVAISAAFPSSESTPPKPVLMQDEKVVDKVLLQPAEALCQLDKDFPDPPGQHDSNTGSVMEGSGKAGLPTDPAAPAAHVTPSLPQPTSLRQAQDENPCRTAFPSQIPNTGAYLSLRDLQTQYNHCSV